VRLWADGLVELVDGGEEPVLADCVGPDAWSYLAATDDDYAGFETLASRIEADVYEGEVEGEWRLP